MKTEAGHLFHCDSLSDKEIKNLEILEFIRRKGAISRTEISRIAGINIVSVSNYIKSYIQKKLVFEKGLDVSTGGRKPELIELDTAVNHIVGIDVRPENIRLTLTDLKSKVVGKELLETSKQGDKDRLGEICDGIKNFTAKSNIEFSSIKAMGIAVSEDSSLEIVKAIRKRFGIDAFAGTHALCAAFGEKELNPAADVETFLSIYSDVGSGVVVRQYECYESKCRSIALNTSAGKNYAEYEKEFHEHCRYLQPWSDAFGIVRSAKREVSKGVGTRMVELARADINSITDDVVIRAAMEGDDVALGIIETVGINLGLRIAYLINLFGPQVVAISGGLEKGAKIILGTIKKMVDKLSLKSRAGAVRIIPSVLGEDAVCLGAASLAIREIFLKA